MLFYYLIELYFLNTIPQADIFKLYSWIPNNQKKVSANRNRRKKQQRKNANSFVCFAYNGRKYQPIYMPFPMSAQKKLVNQMQKSELNLDHDIPS